MKVMAPWLYGLAALAILSSYLGIQVSESRQKENDKAWERYAQEREKDGLGPILGYSSKNQSTLLKSDPGSSSVSVKS